ncbi:MAG TPA: SAF domain-containing protein [Acidimicrobiales bacterium]|nr:SAF domain-containing protein [Acidimicrobiales bacterium]
MVWREVRDPGTDGAPDHFRGSLDQREPPGSTRSSRRLVGRRRALPSGRPLFGGFLVAGAALIVFAAVLAGAGGGSTRHFVVASRSLQAGSVLEPGDLSTTSMRLPSGAAASAFGDPDRVVGRTLAVSISQGELVETSMLTANLAPDVRPVTIPVDPAGLASLIAGQPVDVLEASGTSGSASISVIVRGATLLSVSRGGSGFLSNPSSGVATIGVASLDEVEAVVGASRSGTLTLVAAEPSDGVGPGPGSGDGSSTAGGSNSAGAPGP